MAIRKWMSSVARAGALGLLAVAMSSQPALGKEPRFPQLTMDQMNEQQKALADKIIKAQQRQQKTASAGVGNSNPIGGPFNVLLRSPVLAERVMDLTIGYLNDKTSVPIKLNEFTMLIVAAQWRADYIWLVHASKAVKFGLSPDIVEAVRTHERPSKMAPDEAVVYDFVTELTTKKRLSEETFARARKIFTDQQLVDLTACIGTYTSTSISLAMAGEDVPVGQPDPFE